MDNIEELNSRLAKYLGLASRAEGHAANLDDVAQREQWQAVAISWMSLAERVKGTIRRSM